MAESTKLTEQLDLAQFLDEILSLPNVVNSSAGVALVHFRNIMRRRPLRRTKLGIELPR